MEKERACMSIERDLRCFSVALERVASVQGSCKNVLGATKRNQCLTLEVSFGSNVMEDNGKAIDGERSADSGGTRAELQRD